MKYFCIILSVVIAMPISLLCVFGDKYPFLKGLAKNSLLGKIAHEAPTQRELGGCRPIWIEHLERLEDYLASASGGYHNIADCNLNKDNKDVNPYAVWKTCRDESLRIEKVKWSIKALLEGEFEDCQHDCQKKEYENFITFVKLLTQKSRQKGRDRYGEDIKQIQEEMEQF